ncbi:MAG: hypothetical protein VCB59_11975, partial [Gammaproteobacteria bacterium]
MLKVLGKWASFATLSRPKTGSRDLTSLTAKPSGELTERRYRPRSSGTGGMPTNVSKLPSI